MSTGERKETSTAEQRTKIEEVRKHVGPMSSMERSFCSDAAILRYLTAKNWSAKKASKMLRETLRWRIKYKPDAIRWEEVAEEAKEGKIYRAKYSDKLGRPVLVMRPGIQNTSSAKGQIRHWIYCIENCMLNFQEAKQQMVWLIDFRGWNVGSVSLRVTRDTAHVLQHHYPEMLGLAIFYDPPKVFEPFLKIVTPFLEPKTCETMRFVYSDDADSQKVLEEFFDLDEVGPAFGGRNPVDFDYDEFQERMKNDELKFFATKEQGDVLITPRLEPIDVIITPTLDHGEEAQLNKPDKASSVDGLHAQPTEGVLECQVASKGSQIYPTDEKDMTVQMK